MVGPGHRYWRADGRAQALVGPGATPPNKCNIVVIMGFKMFIRPLQVNS